MTQLDVLRAWVQERWSVGQIFTLQDVYAFESAFSTQYPHNMHVRDKLRQLLQRLRDEGTLDFLDDQGTYRRVS